MTEKADMYKFLKENPSNYQSNDDFELDPQSIYGMLPLINPKTTKYNQMGFSRFVQEQTNIEPTFHLLKRALNHNKVQREVIISRQNFFHNSNNPRKISQENLISQTQRKNLRSGRSQLLLSQRSLTEKSQKSQIKLEFSAAKIVNAPRRDTQIFEFEEKKPRLDKKIPMLIHTEFTQGLPTSSFSQMLLTPKQELLIYGGLTSSIHKYYYLQQGEQFVQVLPEDQNQGYVGGGLFFDDHSFLCGWGGELGFNQKLRAKDISSIFFKAKDTKVETEKSNLEGRRGFSHALVMNRYWVVYGGIDRSEQFMNECHLWDLERKDWQEINILNDVDGQQAGLAYGKMCFVQKYHGKMTHWSQGTMFQGKKETILHDVWHLIQVMDEGVYAFGGKRQNGTSSGVMKLLKFGSQFLKWQDLSKAKGKAPLPRYHHTMNFVPQILGLVICGGYTEIGYQTLSDVHVFDLQLQQWIEIECQGLNMIPRFGHCAVTRCKSLNIESQVVIFGGQDNQKHKDSNFQILEFGKKFNLDKYQIFHKKIKETNHNPNIKTTSIGIQFTGKVQNIHQKQQTKLQESINTNQKKNKIQIKSFLPNPYQFFEKKEA